MDTVHMMHMNDALLQIIPAVALFCFISTITPGPNNLLLAHSGAHFGIRRTLPHVIGIRFGMTCLNIAVLMGLGEIFQIWPQLHQIFAFGAAGFILYLAFKIIRAKPIDTTKDHHPMTAWQAASFQLINPKSWASLIAASSAFTLHGTDYWPSAILVIVMFNTATLPGTFMWITIGKMISSKLQNPRIYQAFNVTMGCLLLTTLPMIFMTNQ